MWDQWRNAVGWETGRSQASDRRDDLHFHVERLEDRALLAADMFTYREIDTVNNVGGSGGEWSGAAYWTDGADEYLLMLESGQGGSRDATIHRVDLDGTGRVQVARLDGFQDSEGLAWIGGDDFAFVEEEDGHIYIANFDPTATSSTTITTFTSVTMTDPTGKSGLVANLVAVGQNKGLEGVTFDDNGTPSNTSDDTFYVAKERDRDFNGGGIDSPGEEMGIYSVSRSTGVTDEFLVGQGNYPDHVNDIVGLFYDCASDIIFYCSSRGSQPNEYVGQVTDVSTTPMADMNPLFLGTVPLNGTSASDVPDNAEGIALSGDGLYLFTVADDKAVDFVAYRTADMDSDGDVDSNDIDTLVKAIDGTIADTVVHDIDRDGVVDNDDDDIDLLVESVLGTFYGDANLDGDVDGDDLDIWHDNAFSSADTWAEADFNRDGSVDGSDFNLWSVNKFTTTAAASLGFADGDVNFDGVVDISDIDWLYTMKNLYESDTTGYASMVDIYDVDGDSAFDQDDLDELIRNILGIEYGDANGDGNVNSQDLNILALNWHTYVSSWADGDFNGDGYVDEDDEDLLNMYWGT